MNKSVGSDTDRFLFHVNHLLCHPAVDCYILSVDEVISFLTKEEAQACHIFRFADTSGRMLAMVYLPQVVIVPRFNPSGGYRIDGDMPRG